METRLVGFDGQQILSSTIPNELGRGGLRMQGIRRDDGILEGHGGQHALGHRDLVFFLADIGLGHQM